MNIHNRMYRGCYGNFDAYPVRSPVIGWGILEFSNEISCVMLLWDNVDQDKIEGNFNFHGSVG